MSLEVYDVIDKLRREGKDYDEIAEKTGLKRSTVKLACLGLDYGSAGQELDELVKRGAANG